MNILKTLAFTASAITLASTAHAVDPVAVWSGFNNLESGTFTADIGSAVPDATTGAITLGSKGIKFANTGDAWSGKDKGLTVAVKYSNFKSGTAASLVSLQQNSETTAAGIDKIGAWVNANGKVQGIWQGGAYGTENGTLPASGVVFVRYNDSNGTSVLLQNGTSLYAEGGLKSSNNNWGKSFAVGSFANGASNVASGMTIEAVAIFDSRLSDSDIAAYEFPEPEPATFETLAYEGFLTTTFIDTGWDFDLTKLDEYEITGLMSGSSIANRPAASTGYWAEPAASATAVAKFQMQVYQYNKADDHWLKAVEVELKKGDNGNVWMRAVRTGYVDGGLTDPKGSIKITNWNSTLATSETAGGYGVCKVIVKVPAATVKVPSGKVVAMNFRDSDGQTLGESVDAGIEGFYLPGKAWTNKTGANGSNVSVTAFDMEADALVSGTTASFTYSSKNTWHHNDASSPLLKGYLDDGDSDSNTANITVAVPFEEYDLLLICSSDQGSGKYHSFKINDTYYYANSEGVAQVGDVNSTWGATMQSVPEFGKSIMRVAGLKGADGLHIVGNYRHGNEVNRGCIAAVVLVEMKDGVPVVKNPSKAEINDNSAWTDLGWDVVPTASDKAELTVSASATLTLDETTAFKSLKLIGSDDLTIAGLDSTNVGLIQKINTNEFTGKLRYEFDASAGFTADETLRNFIRTASDKITFVFKGSGNKGAALGYGFTVNAAIHSHIVFDGGTHTMSYGYGGSGADGNCFGVNASNDNPTVLVTGNATLNFTAKDFSYWNGVADMNGVIRVNNGATLNFLANGSNTIYYRQRLCLEPGASVTFPNVLSDSKPVMRFLGGTAENKEVIYVLPPTGNATTATISGNIFFAKDDTHGFGVFVDANSRLKWTGNMLVVDNNDDKAIVKRGAGVLEYFGTMDGVVQVAAGAIGGNGSFRKLTFGANGTLDLDNGAPTITGSLSTPVSKQLNLAIDVPTHMMDVITLPAAADKTGWTAVVNGNTGNPCELVAEGNTLKLKWKIPPTITVDPDDVAVEVADDWNGGVVKIGLGGLTVGDYEGDIRYLLKFGDKVVYGSAANGVASFELSADEFTAGNIYRGTFELEYGEGNPAIAAAEITVYAGEKTYGTKDGWINESTTTLKTTGTYDPDQGASVDAGFIKFANPTDVIFTPTNSPADYVAKCDSEVTFEIFSGEEAIPDDDDTVAEGLQAGVKIVDNGSGGVKFQFVSGDEWIDGPVATLNTTYTVTVNFHYAKDANDTDSVTYTVGETVLPCARRANVAEKLETISFADGTQIASLVGKCEIEVADPVTKGIEPGADGKELKATDEATAEAEAAKIPVVVPSEVAGGITEGLDDEAANKAKADYKAKFKVVAKQGADGKFVAIVVPTADAEKKAEDEAQKVSEDVLTKVTALTGDQTEGTATIEKAVPGFFYGVAENGEVVNMKAAEPSEWKMAGASGKVELKVTKPANAKARFYKVICSPLPKK